jgi:hypothetical protein
MAPEGLRITVVLHDKVAERRLSGVDDLVMGLMVVQECAVDSRRRKSIFSWSVPFLGESTIHTKPVRWSVSSNSSNEQSRNVFHGLRCTPPNAYNSMVTKEEIAHHRSTRGREHILATVGHRAIYGTSRRAGASSTR